MPRVWKGGQNAGRCRVVLQHRSARQRASVVLVDSTLWYCESVYSLNLTLRTPLIYVDSSAGP